MISALLRMAVGLCLFVLPPVGAQAQPASAPKTVGLISAMTDLMTVTTLARNAISDQERRFPIESWKISDRVAKAAAAQLGKGFKVQRIPVPAGAFLSLGNPGFFAPSFDNNYARLVQAIAGSQKADFYLAITPGYSRIGNADRIARGLGVIKSETLLTQKDVVYCLVLYRVFDAQFQMVRSEGALLGKASRTETIAGPSLSLEGKERLPPEAYVVANDNRTRELLVDLLDKDLAATLPKLFARK